MELLKQVAHKVSQRLGRTDPQPGAWEPDQYWRELSDNELAQITGRHEPMSRAEAVLRLRLMDFDGFPDASSTDRSWTRLFRYVGPMYVTVEISNHVFNLSWTPSLLPGGDLTLAIIAAEGWVEEQDCLDDLAAIAACDSDLSRSLSGLKVEGVPITLGIAAVDTLFRVIPKIFPDWPDLNEVVAEQAVERAVATATVNTGVAT